MHKGAPKVEVNLPVYPTEVHQAMQGAGRCIGKYVKTQYIRCYEAQESHVRQAIKTTSAMLRRFLSGTLSVRHRHLLRVSSI